MPELDDLEPCERKHELDVTAWTTIAHEKDPSDGAIFTQFLRHGAHYLYRCVWTDSEGFIHRITPLGCLDRDAVNP